MEAELLCHYCSINKLRNTLLLSQSEAYFKPNQTSKTEIFAKIVKGWKSSTIFGKRFI